MSSHDPFPQLQGFMADQDIALREQAHRHLTRGMEAMRLSADIACDWIADLLRNDPRGPQLIPMGANVTAQLDGSSVRAPNGNWLDVAGLVTTPEGRDELCYLKWGEWYLTCFEYAFALHLMALKQDAANSDRQAQFTAQLARLPTAQAWF